MNKQILFILLVVCLLLTGCGYRKTAILALYSTDAEATYLYDDEGNFYAYEDCTAIPIARKFEETPALQLYDSTKDFCFTYVSTGKYKAEFEDICAYSSALVDEGYVLDVTQASPYLLEAYLSSESTDLKFYVTCDGYVRIYADENGEGVLPPYTDIETLNISR